MEVNPQTEFLIKCMSNMTTVLVNCNREKKSCLCSVQVSYVDDQSLPEPTRYRTSIYCAQKGDDFYDKSAQELQHANQSVDVFNQKNNK